MNKYLFTFLLCFAYLFSANAQNDELEKIDVSSRQRVSTYLGFGFVLGSQDFTGAEMQYGLSTDFQYGSRSYINFAENQFFRLGTGIYYRNLKYRLEQDDAKRFPSTDLADRERLSFHALGLELFASLRIDGRSIKKQGIGLDIGAYGEWFAGTRHIIIEKFEESDPIEELAKRGKYVNKKLKYINRWHYGILARINFRNFTIYGDYRLTEIFDKDFIETRSYSGDFAKFVVGVQIDM